MKKRIYLISFLIATILIVSFYKQQHSSTVEASPSEAATASYESFVALNEEFETLLSKKYSNILQPTYVSATGYSANEGGDWAEGNMDLMEGTDTSRPLKHKYELIHAESGLYTQIVLTYAPELTEKTYLNTNRIYGTETKDSHLPEGTTLIDIAINSLSAPGVFIEILTTPIYGAEMEQSSNQELAMVQENAAVTKTVQKFFNQQSN
ncbi:hypothetical protein [Saccharibacillus sp. JS10]|uniref:hypothetical protein n=1 Tax=Saccharibacillus sp. JS10 TaxID=2950552 RepID=UPI00210C13CE|nr:hypothetical protein [Saccharibacillus sp. JS10]MCQ4085621.1 hypothetical protein [Saccharibacillus sp. JS10]